jgi:hypothetical protein
VFIRRHWTDKARWREKAPLWGMAQAMGRRIYLV